MSRFFARFKTLFARLLGYWPSEIPTLNIKEFDEFTDSVLDTYDLPRSQSYRHAVASMIMHLGPTQSRKSKAFFAKSIKRVMANKVAYEVIEQIRKQDKEEAAAQVQKDESPLEQTQQASS